MRLALRKIPGVPLGSRVPSVVLAALIVVLAGTHAPAGPGAGWAEDPGRGIAFSSTGSAEVDRAMAGVVRHAVSRPAAFCWSEGTPPEMMGQFDLALRDFVDPSYYIDDQDRWSETATDGPGLGQGDPTVLTWGFLPDGTNIGDPGEPVPSRVVQMMDAQYGAGPGGSDLSQRPWFPLFQQVFDRWSEVTGVTYVYEPNDDGAAFPYIEGQVGVRPDVRIAAGPIDGNSGFNIYAYNYFPDVGDMVIDSDNAPNFGNPANQSRLLRNVVSHEHGHGLGLAHSCPIEQTKLMEPTVTTAFDGPQHDDILGGNRGYGDGAEKPAGNDTPQSAYFLGELAPGDTLRRGIVTIDGRDDVDYYAFSVPPTMRVSLTMAPVGSRYFNAAQQGNDCPLGWYFDSLRENNVGVHLLGKDGSSLLAQADYRPLGSTESVENFLLPEGGGTYFVKAFGDTNKTQMYELWITASAGQAPEAICKTVKSCRPDVDPLRFNNGSFDPDDDEITITVSPESPYPPGVTDVTMIVSDGFNADTCMTTVTVNRPPVGVARNVTVAGDTLEGCYASVSASDFDNGSFDEDGDDLVFSLLPAGPFPPGQSPVQLVVTDRCGAADTVEAVLTVSCAVPVQLASFAVARRGGEAVVTWEVAEAENHAGFHVHRQGAVGSRERLTRNLLSGRVRYEFVDAAPPAGTVGYWLEELSRTGDTVWYGPVTLGERTIPAGLVLAVEPNPFAARSTIVYSLPDTRGVTVEIFDASGRRVRTLIDQVQEGGEHRVSWDGQGSDGSRAVPGLYFVRMLAGDVTVVRKAVLLPGR